MGAGPSRDRLRQSIVKLTESDVPDAGESAEAANFWDDLWKISTTPEEIFELIKPDDVRRLREQKTKNLRILFTQAVAQMCQVVETPSPIYFDQALNCVRVLTRLLPFLLENPDDGLVHDLCWARQPLEQQQPAAQQQQDGATAGDSKEGPGSSIGEAYCDPLAVLLVHAAMHLLFLPQFTIDIPGEDDLLRATSAEREESDGDDEEAESVVWAPGVGVGEESSVTSAYDRNRLEVLRLLITCFCEPLYQQSADSGSTTAPPALTSRWLAVATARDCPHAASLFHSLLNAVLGFDPVGWGLPYGSMWVGSVHQRYLDAAIQVLLLLLDYGQPAGASPPQGGAAAGSTEAGAPPSSSSSSSSGSGNYYRELLASIHKPEDLSFIFDGMVRLLNSVHQAQSTYLPGAMLQVQYHQELLILLWKLLEENPAFMPHILKRHDITQLVVPICYLIFDARRDTAKVGLVHICTFILLKLSGERNFGVALNKPFDQRLPTDLPLFTGNNCDLLVIVLHKVVVNGTEKLSSLYHCFLTIICNVSPYAKSLSIVASVKLLNLFELFTSPRFLYAAESNHLYVSLLLEVLNNAVQYQYDGNAHLVYAIVRRKDAFVKLANLTLPIAIKAARETSTRHGSNAGGSSGGSGDLSGTLPPTEAPTQVINTQAQQAQGGPSSTAAQQPPSQPPQAEGTVAPSGQPAAGPSATPAPPPSSSAVVPTRFMPTQAWLETVKGELPLTTIMRLLQYLVPQIDELVEHGRETGQGVDERAILGFLRSTTLVGLLPVPHPIVIRKYQANRFTGLWFTAYLWGVIFLRQQQLPLFDGATIRLFTVTVSSN